ncbi:AAA family ATPase [Vagococcus carniphilus]|uniref:AAA family ATPase n=1 Tax=Vagococcus carniphilus TaxID=218144 RepID=A0AAW8U688_9ENTE|nr:AAA family ATPase [Vagococcus carniphilus]MDT2834331.1 AAA family ATPase [Vagococcus carniphilus]
MIRDEIVEWVKSQQYWSQVIANSLLRGEKIDDEILNKIYIIFKQELKLLNEPLVKEKLEFLNINNSNDESVKMRWKSVSNVSGVNALKKGETLNIGEQVTVLYGENGSGKSGYTRLLNNSFVSRGDKSILANIFEEEVLEPSATFHFEDMNGNLIDKLFPVDRNNSLFNSVSVFDTVSAVHDLTKETELAFVPMEFNFFEDFIDAFLAIKRKLENEIKENTKTNEFGDFFEKETTVKKIVQEISEQTDFSQIKALANTSEIEEIYKEKVNRKKELLSLNINEKLKVYRKFKEDLIKIREKSEVLNKKYSDERINKTKELLIERNTLKELSSKEGLAQLEGENIYNLGSPEWKEFIVAANKYNNSIDQEVTDCIFCGQNIEEVTVIDKYWKYLKSTAEKNLGIAEKKIEKLKKDFDPQDITIIVKDSRLEEWIKENSISLHSKLIEAEKEWMNINSTIVRSLTKKEWEEETKIYTFDTSIFDETFEILEKKNQQLDAEKVNKELKEIEEFINEFNSKLHLNNILPRIEVYMNNMKWVNMAKKINMSTQKITTFQNKLFSKYVSRKYIQKFDIECKKLNANFSAEIQQRGRKGTTLNRLEIKGKKPIEILSEGEQRSIALANFLAETSLNDNNVCLVFDDPVCSLDYKRREVISKRLVEEAKEKQIVILTHDLTFLLSIQKNCSAQNINCRTTTIRKLNTEAGIVQEEAVPWVSMPVKKRIGVLKHRLQELEKFHRKINAQSIEDFSEYEFKAKSWCELLRETWERCIEEILLNNSVQRFSPAIQTQSLKQATFTKELYSEVEVGMTNCSNWVHDRAAGLGEEVPEPKDLIIYLETCEKFVKTNRPK